MPKKLQYAIEEFCVKEGLTPAQEEFLKEVLPKIALDKEIMYGLRDIRTDYGLRHALP